MGLDDLGQGPLAPEGRVLLLDGHPRGPSDEAVGVAQVRPCGLDGLRLAAPVEPLQLVPQPARLEGRRPLGRHGLGRALGAVIRHAIQARLRVPPADGEVHRPVRRVDHDVRQRQGRAGHELLQLAGVRRALRLQVHRVELAVAPVADVQGLAVLRREARGVAERDARRRAGADVDHRRQAVDRIGGPLAGAVAVAELGPAGDVHDPRGPVPGRIHVPLHVGVVREQLAVAVERDVERVAEPDRDQVPGRAVGADAADEPAGCLLVRP